jgi:hypothetical protein
MWSSVAKLVVGKDDNRCREKWVNVLDPTLCRGPFTAREDELLKKLVDRDGPGNWAEKAQWFPGRTDSIVMGRWKKGGLADASQVQAYTAESKLRRQVTVPQLDRRGMFTQLRPCDFVPVLRVKGVQEGDGQGQQAGGGNGGGSASANGTNDGTAGSTGSHRGGLTNDSRDVPLPPARGGAGGGGGSESENINPPPQRQQGSVAKPNARTSSGQTEPANAHQGRSTNKRTMQDGDGGTGKKSVKKRKTPINVDVTDLALV